MDNRITKKRLHAYLSYQWIMIILFALVAIILANGIYAAIGVRPTTGQHFKVYYDNNFSSTTSSKLESLIFREKALSYDVLEEDYEVLVGDGQTDVLGIRLSVQEGDIIITDRKQPPKEAELRDEKTIRAKYIVDVHSVYTIDGLLKDAKTYLNKFAKDGVTDLTYANMDVSKIDAHFLERMKGDNRFRNDKQKEEGKLLERARIEKLCEDVAYFEKFLNEAPEEYFFRHTKYEHLKELWGTEDYDNAIKAEIEAGRANAIYGLNVGMFSGGKSQPEEYFKLNGAENAKDSVMMAFNFLEYQPDLQFECLQFMCAIIRECTGI